VFFRQVQIGAGISARDRLYGTSVRIAADRAAEARQEADKLAWEAWTKRMLAFKGPAQPSPTLGDALNAGYLHLEVRCLGCDTHQTVALDIVRRPKSTPIHELERYIRCKDCSQVRGYPYKRISRRIGCRVSGDWPRRRRRNPCCTNCRSRLRLVCYLFFCRRVL
jgi:ribosomal protein S27E